MCADTSLWSNLILLFYQVIEGNGSYKEELVLEKSGRLLINFVVHSLHILLFSKYNHKIRFYVQKADPKRSIFLAYGGLFLVTCIQEIWKVERTAKYYFIICCSLVS
ncbi:unnamed protein product [Trifolium pratense]|uniref:Uncharacterized protein n=1 Tax=Trifolium pratense TaxID=57577 RepID=A0ACB0KFW4_TRIPR|nr:unnamed protein product [Trifolium pratense]